MDTERPVIGTKPTCHSPTEPRQPLTHHWIRRHAGRCGRGLCPSYAQRSTLGACMHSMHGHWQGAALTEGRKATPLLNDRIKKWRQVRTGVRLGSLADIGESNQECPLYPQKQTC